MRAGLQVMGLQVLNVHPGSLALIPEGPFCCVVSRHPDVRQTGWEGGRADSQSVQTVVCMRPCSHGQDLEPSGRKEWFLWAIPSWIYLQGVSLQIKRTLDCEGRTRVVILPLLYPSASLEKVSCVFLGLGVLRPKTGSSLSLTELIYGVCHGTSVKSL